MEELEKRGLEIVTKHEAELDRLDRFTKIGLTISEIKYILERLKQMGPWKRSELTQEVLYETISLLTALSVTYGRLFAQGDATKINRKDIPQEWRGIHDELIELRNKRFAHHDSHHSIKTDLDFDFDGRSFVVYPRIKIQIPQEVPEKTEELINWISDHMKERTAKVLERLSRESGCEWVVAPLKGDSDDEDGQG